MLLAVGRHLGSLAGSDLARRCAEGKLAAERRSLLPRIRRIGRRLSVPVGARKGKLRGYPTRHEHYEKRRRLQHLEARLEEVERRLEEGRVSICRGGAHFAKIHHHLDEAGIDEAT